MPQFPFSQALTANQLGFNPLSSWQYDRMPWDAVITFIVRSTTAGARLTLYAGGDTMVQRAPIQSGGTAGVTPSPLNTTPIQFVARAGDKILPQIDEVLGGTPTVDGLIQVDPL